MTCLLLQNNNFLIMLFKSQSGVAYPLLNNDICVNNCLMGKILQFLLNQQNLLIQMTQGVSSSWKSGGDSFFFVFFLLPSGPFHRGGNILSTSGERRHNFTGSQGEEDPVYWLLFAEFGRKSMEFFFSVFQHYTCNTLVFHFLVVQMKLFYCYGLNKK